jgi:hypothetical protein
VSTSKHLDLKKETLSALQFRNLIVLDAAMSFLIVFQTDPGFTKPKKSLVLDPTTSINSSSM